VRILKHGNKLNVLNKATIQVLPTSFANKLSSELLIRDGEVEGGESERDFRGGGKFRRIQSSIPKL
jgi:hypothetical protein